MTRLMNVCAVALLSIIALALPGCDGGSGSSPTATAKALISAFKANDIDAALNCMSKSTVAMLEGFAGGREKLKEKASKRSAAEREKAEKLNIEFTNEVITGDKATVDATEIKPDGTKGRTDKLEFVKEDGRWKIGGMPQF